MLTDVGGLSMALLAATAMTTRELLDQLQDCVRAHFQVSVALNIPA